MGRGDLEGRQLLDVEPGVLQQTLDALALNAHERAEHRGAADRERVRHFLRKLRGRDDS